MTLPSVTETPDEPTPDPCFDPIDILSATGATWQSKFVLDFAANTPQSPPSSLPLNPLPHTPPDVWATNAPVPHYTTSQPQEPLTVGDISEADISEEDISEEDHTHHHGHTAEPTHTPISNQELGSHDPPVPQNTSHMLMTAVSRVQQLAEQPAPDPETTTISQASLASPTLSEPTIEELIEPNGDIPDGTEAWLNPITRNFEFMTSIPHPIINTTHMPIHHKFIEVIYKNIFVSNPRLIPMFSDSYGGLLAHTHFKMVTYISAILTISGFLPRNIHKLIPQMDKNGHLWCILEFTTVPNPHRTIAGGSTSSHFTVHASTAAGTIGILLNTHDWRGDPQPIPLTKPIIYPTTGYYDTNSQIPFRGHFSLFYEEGSDTSYNTQARISLINALTDFPKNAINVGVTSRVIGVRESHVRKNCGTAQQSLIYPKDPHTPTIVASLGGYKACIRADHNIPSGVIFNVTAPTPPGWSSLRPFVFT